jgi:hypothetical protein
MIKVSPEKSQQWLILRRSTQGGNHVQNTLCFFADSLSLERPNFCSDCGLGCCTGFCGWRKHPSEFVEWKKFEGEGGPCDTRNSVRASQQQGDGDSEEGSHSPLPQEEGQLAEIDAHRCGDWSRRWGRNRSRDYGEGIGIWRSRGGHGCPLCPDRGRDRLRFEIRQVGPGLRSPHPVTLKRATISKGFAPRGHRPGAYRALPRPRLCIGHPSSAEEGCLEEAIIF